MNFLVNRKGLACRQELMNAGGNPRGELFIANLQSFWQWRKVVAWGNTSTVIQEDQKYMCCRNRAMKPWDVKSLFRL